MNWLGKRRQGDGLVAVVRVGSRGLACARVRRAVGQSPSLVYAEFLSHDNAAGARARALTELARRRQLDRARATSLLGIGDYNLVLVEAPDVPATEQRAAVRWRVKELIDFSLDEAVVDIFRVPTLKGGQDNMLYAVVARAGQVRALIDEIGGAGIGLDVVDIPEFAIRNLAGLMPEDVGGVAFVHLEEAGGLITITRQRTLYLSRRLDLGRARLLAAAPTSVTPALEGLLDAIVVEIQRSLDYYERQFAQPPVSGVVIAPLGAEIAGLTEYLSSQLGVPVRMLRLAELLEVEGGFEPAIESECLTAIGAALRSEDGAP